MIEEAKEGDWQLKVKSLKEMKERQEAVRNGVSGTVQDTEADVIVNSFKNFKEDFVKMQNQIKAGDYSGINAWCAQLEVGVTVKKRKIVRKKKTRAYKGGYQPVSKKAQEQNNAFNSMFGKGKKLHI